MTHATNDPRKDHGTDDHTAPGAAETPDTSDTPDTQSVWDAFTSVEIRVGTVTEARPFPEARTPAIKLHIDFGAGDTRWSSAQITDLYTPEQLVGRQVMAVTNLPPKRIAGFKSECLTLGVPQIDGSVVLVAPDHEVPVGARLF